MSLRGRYRRRFKLDINAELLRRTMADGNVTADFFHGQRVLA